MAIPIIGDLIDTAGEIIGKAVVDKDKKRELEFKLEELKDKANERFHEANMGQIEVNKVEAQHKSIFVAGWRPAVGWVGAAGLAYAAIFQPVASWIARVTYGYGGQFPELDNSLLTTVLLGILGLGGLRTFEKYKGVSSDAPVGKSKKPEYLDGIY
ncbi:MAG: hypothetical protein Tp178MES00d2C33159091_27 [Prokaryotic dsDNA virus sp.]|uniref:3TM-type holin n=1 Tax=Thalassospira sp. TaxID=1912094 RepID=UPI000C47D179|nr:3TM-type holin [Thalassospira sp.]QDP60976.1 MAG: hypothetical protein Tp178MES00d2C33159091_27 [Prokaryotic dsDNA virus sp.]MAZ33837.1 hypothetical protein [Thalassospira sp.]MAZ33893.1 hypothetical protein [Thalassospira sp.]MAZ34614.1 hypothetical protein [Thalassospira sp.]QDP64519.1 MAG: hypothetical protein Tp178SUR1139111_39 [Prokaryotic dsDNA virus sp.]|tara:strand:- start:88 stop:555 length:468 start_codon:yes stop_codon:yes gene_type:complete